MIPFISELQVVIYFIEAATFIIGGWILWSAIWVDDFFYGKNMIAAARRPARVRGFK